MMLTYNAMTQDEYVALVVGLISASEGYEAAVYQPANDNATIGYGYTFNRANNLALWSNAGIALTDAQTATLNAIDNATTVAEKNALALGFTKNLSKEEARNLLAQTYTKYEGPANQLEMTASSEKATLVSITYNRGDWAVINKAIDGNQGDDFIFGNDNGNCGMSKPYRTDKDIQFLFMEAA